MGITCIHRPLANVLAVIRVVSFFLIFSTVFAAVGEDDPVYVNKKAEVVVLGNLSINEDLGSMAPRALARQGCQGRTNTATYYGQLLSNGDCELNLSRIPPPIQFGFSYEPKKLNLQKCETEHFVKEDFPCENGFVVCMYSNVTGSIVTGQFEGCTVLAEKPIPRCVPADSKNTSFTCTNFPDGSGNTMLKK